MCYCRQRRRQARSFARYMMKSKETMKLEFPLKNKKLDKWELLDPLKLLTSKDPWVQRLKKEKAQKQAFQVLSHKLYLREVGTGK